MPLLHFATRGYTSNKHNRALWARQERGLCPSQERALWASHYPSNTTTHYTLLHYTLHTLLHTSERGLRPSQHLPHTGYTTLHLFPLRGWVVVVNGGGGVAEDNNGWEVGEGSRQASEGRASDEET